MDQFIAQWQFSTQSLNFKWVEDIALLLILSGISWIIWRVILGKLIARSENTITEWDNIILHGIRAPVSVLIWLWPLSYALSSLFEKTTTLSSEWLSVSRRVLLFALFLWILLRLGKKIEAYLIRSEKYNQTTVAAMGHLFHLLLAVIGVFTALQAFGISLTGLLTFGGMGGLIVGLAAKDLLSNIFGGLMIYFDKPFNVGEWISSPDRHIEGTVERIGMRMTMIRTFSSRPLYVPNSVFSNIIVENPSRMQNRRIFETIKLRYRDADKIATVVNDVKKMLQDHPDIEQRTTLMVNFDAFAGSSLNFFIYTFTKTVNWARYHEVKQHIMLQVIDIIHTNGADLAFPTRTFSFDTDNEANVPVPL
ncbi:mechanosensitive ion channel family protein [Candidatus Enterovibrio escicola]|uniref:mechanosensitive ion channel family protein n=1 Tax=Candidatus Enterovibrio escicola TaxID=1927127 RepID=UPI001237F25F|nr:mechanosensitive ion channel family protein [Candidatus Enterovibrio escacola]